MRLIRDYEASSGQQIDISKSAFYLGSKAANSSGAIASITRINHKTLPFTYLGGPILNGKLKAVYFENIIENIRAKLVGWKARILTFGGRITLIKSVFSSIPIYTLANCVVPKGVLRRIERHMASFLWNAQGE